MAEKDSPGGEGVRQSESVVAFFNRGKRLAKGLIEENEQLRRRVRNLERDRRRPAPPDTKRDSGETAAGGEGQ